MPKVKIIIIVPILFFACNRPITNCNISFSALQQLLGSSIQMEQPIDKCFKTDVIKQEDELAGISWLVKKYYRDEHLFFQIESNWKNDSIVSRIIIYDSTIKIVGGLSVGEEFGDIEPYILDSIPSVQDGYLVVRAKGMRNVVVELDIGNIKNEQLFYGVSDINQIPDSLKVKSIILTLH